jgi:glycosyltransferase involved in cell wall biosynthesis
MRVLVFLPRLAYGGAQKQGALLARHLREAGLRVEVCAFPAGPTALVTPLRTDLESHGILCSELPAWPVLDWSFSASPLSLRRLKKEIFGWPRQLKEYERTLPRGEFDVIVPFTFWPCLVAALARHSLTADRVIWNHRGGDDAAGIAYTPFIVKQVLRRKPSFVANSTAGRQFLARTFALDPEAIRVLPNAFVPEIDYALNDATRSGSSGRLVLVHVANFYPEKDVATVLRAARELKRRNCRFEVHFAGAFLNAVDQQSFHQLRSELGLEEEVAVHGSLSRRELHDLLSGAHVGLLSSRSEGLPNSVMEYMYYGLPVVASDIPGVREVVGEANRSWLFAPGDAVSMADLVESLARDAGLRRSIGAANRIRIDTAFSIEPAMRGWWNVLRGTVSGSGRAVRGG